MAKRRLIWAIVGSALMAVCMDGRVSASTSGDLEKGGELHFRMQEYEEALSLWRQAAREDPGDVYLRVRMGTALTRLERYAEAETVFREAIVPGPDGALAYYHLGALFMHEHRYDAARQNLRLALASVPWYPNAHYLLGYMAEKEGLYDTAGKEYIAELNVNPGNADDMYHLLKLQKEEKFGQNWERRVHWTPRKIVGISMALAFGFTVFVWSQVRAARQQDRQAPTPAD